MAGISGVLNRAVTAAAVACASSQLVKAPANQTTLQRQLPQAQATSPDLMPYDHRETVIAASAYYGSALPMRSLLYDEERELREAHFGQFKQ